MYQLIAGIKYPRKQAGSLSCRITLIAPGPQSHRVTVCFSFYWVSLAAPSPLSPSALTFCPATNNSSSTCCQTTFLAPWSVSAIWANRLRVAGGVPHSFLHLSLRPENASGHSDMLLRGQNPKPLSQPLLQMESVIRICRVGSLTCWGMESNYELIAHTIKDGNNLRELLVRGHLLSAAPWVICCFLFFIYLLKCQCPLISQSPERKLHACWNHSGQNSKFFLYSQFTSRFLYRDTTFSEIPLSFQPKAKSHILE